MPLADSRQFFTVAPNRWATIKLFLYIYAPLVIVLTGLGYGVLKSEIDTGFQKLAMRETQELEVSKILLEHELSFVASDVLLLSGLPPLKHLLGDQDKKWVIEYFLNMANARQNYDQIRYLDTGHMEVIRINFRNGEADVVPMQELQKKSGRPYIYSSLNLAAGDIYVSPLDLNIEHGKIEVPYRPVIRFGTPVFDREGVKKGAVIINFNGEKLLQNFRRSFERHGMLLNSDGYWLSSRNPAQEWGFMFGRDNTFAKDFPEEWKKISTQEKGSFTTGKGLFTFATIYPSLVVQRPFVKPEYPIRQNKIAPENKSYFWKSVSFVPAAEVPSLAIHRYHGIFVAYLISMALLAVLAFYMAGIMMSRRQLGATIADNETRLREITANLGEGLCVVDMKGCITFANPEAERLSGWSREELVGHDMQDRFFCDRKNSPTLAGSTCNICELIHSGKAHRSDSDILWRKDGSHYPAWIVVSPVIKDGHASGVVVSFDDITERKKMETQLQKSEASLRALLDNVPHLIWLKDTDCRFIAINKPFLRTTGLADMNEVLGKTDFDLWPSELATKYRADDIEVMSAREQKMTVERSMDNGVLRWVETIKTPIQDLKGNLIGTAGFAQDITARIEQEEERLAEVCEQRDLLVREVHHRIKNNLQGVVGLLRQHALNHPEMTEVIDVAIGRIYSISIIHGMQAQSLTEDINLDALMQNVIKAAGCPAVYENNLTCPVFLSSGEAVPVALALNELVTNACKHRLAGTEVAVQLTEKGMHTIISISNSFDVYRQVTTNSVHGLNLVMSLLPRKSANLVIVRADNIYSVELTLSPPVTMSELENIQ